MKGILAICYSVIAVFKIDAGRWFVLRRYPDWVVHHIYATLRNDNLNEANDPTGLGRSLRQQAEEEWRLRRRKHRTAESQTFLA